MSKKTALITGASKGIGKAIAVALANNGYQRLILTAKTISNLSNTAGQINDLNKDNEVFVVSMDITDISTVAGIMAKVWKELGPIDLLVNCAGVAHQSKFLDIKPNTIQEEIATNLVGLYTTTQIIAKRMVSRGSGTIVNVSSLAGVVASPGLASYSATKAAINAFSTALRHELAGTGVNIVVLLPTLVKTSMSDSIKTHFGVWAIDPLEVADSLIKGLNNNKKEIVVGSQAKAAVWLHNLFPSITNWVSKILAPV